MIKKSILFISHDDTLTGAPIVLLNLIRCLRNAGYNCDRIIIKNRNSVLKNEFQKNAEVLVFNDEIKKNQAKISNSIFKSLSRSKEKKDHKRIQQWISEADVVFSNTITNGDFLNNFHISKRKLIVSYIHELQIASDYYTTPQHRKVVFEKTNIFCVPSQAVSCFLQDQYGIEEHKIKKLNYYIPLTAVAEKNQVSESKNDFVVGLIGTLDWRKGAELLPLIILDFFTKYPFADIRFIWKGVDKLTIEYTHIEYELKKIGLWHKVLFEESSRKVDAFYSTIDLLLLCSKEDPYPLVVLEAASFKKPCICFENSGGACEFVKDDAGSIIPYLDISALTSAIFYYYNNKSICIEKGGNAHKRYLEHHFNESLVQTQFENLFT